MFIRLFILCLFLLSSFLLSAQGGKAGQLFFSDRPVDPATADPGSFLRSYELTHKSKLYLTAYLGRPLTQSMQALAPGVPVDSLHRISGYRFSLLVDGRLVYESDIQGAPLPAVRDTETVLHKPLIDPDQEGTWWTQFFWYRFMANGGEAALTDGRHQLRLEIRPHVRAVAGEIMAVGELDLLVNRHPVIDVSAIPLNPIRPYPGLPASKEAFNRDKIKELKGQIETGVFKRINGIVVLKNGRLLVEEYFNGSGRDSLHDSRSVGKSFASTMTGMALRDGYLKSVSQPLSDFYSLKTYAHYSPEKERVTIQDLLTMRAAFDGNDDDGNSPGNEENMYPTENWVRFTLDLPVSATRPRSEWHYFTAGVMLLGDVLNKQVPGGLKQYTDEKLFAPLGIERYQWVYTPQGVPSTAGGLRLTALDLARYGQLYKNGGQWNGRAVLPKAWVDSSFSRHASLPRRPGEYYGYLFWNKTYVVNGKSYEVYYCTGNGGNKVFVFKDQPLVVVITASAYGQPYAHGQVDRMMTEYILPAVL